MQGIPPKAVPTATAPAAITTSEPLGTQGDTNIAKTSKQLVEWYRKIITQVIKNQAALKKQLNK